MTEITFIITEDDYRKIEQHKWNTRDWDRVERTINYLRKKYGKFTVRPVKEEPKEQADNWVSD